MLLNKSLNFKKNETELKMENPTHSFRERGTLCFSLYKNRKLKVKLWWVGARERKKKTLFVPLILSEGNFFNICVWSQCRVHWIHFKNIHTYTYQKNLLHKLFCLFLKSLKVFNVSLSICLPGETLFDNCPTWNTILWFSTFVTSSTFIVDSFTIQSTCILPIGCGFVPWPLNTYTLSAPLLRFRSINCPCHKRFY